MAITAGLIAGGAAIGGGALSFMGAQSQSSKIREAMQKYLDDLNAQRKLFLDQPETGAIRQKLGSYINGDVGYDPNLVGQMKAGAYEDYGKSLSDMSRMTKKAGAASTGVYTPGRADRTSRLLGQNLAANRANSIRDINTKNADVALSNQRLAVSALPTYMPGLPATQVASPDVYSKAYETPNIGSYLGPAVSQAGQTYANLSVMGPIMERMLSSSGMNAWDPVMGTGVAPNSGGYGPGSNFYNYYRGISPTG